MTLEVGICSYCTPNDDQEVLRAAPGLDLMEDPELPTPLLRANVHNVAVGRVRADCALENGLAFFVCGDQVSLLV
jgi:aspartate-semialdehyde dehydrogenase